MAAALPSPARLALVLAALLARCSAMMMNNREPDAGVSKQCVEAVLVEPRSIFAMKLALETAALVRDRPDGSFSIRKLTLVHGKSNRDYVDQLLNTSSILKEARASGRLRLLPLGIDDLGADSQEAPYEIGSGTNRSQPNPIDGRDIISEISESEWHSQYSRLLFKPKFWHQFKCGSILTMQSDTLLCLNSEVRLSEFFGYDFVGPVSSGMSTVSNGGLSLRNRQAMLKCTEYGHPDINENEDIFFSLHCPYVTRKADDVARDRFGIDNGWRIARVPPFGLHKPWGMDGWRGMYESQNLDICKDARILQDQQHK